MKKKSKYLPNVICIHNTLNNNYLHQQLLSHPSVPMCAFMSHLTPQLVILVI